MKRHIDSAVDVWKSHRNYLAKNSVNFQIQNITDFMANLFCPGPFFYYVIDSPSLTLDFISPSVENLLGIHHKKCTIETLLDCIHPEDLNFFLRCEDVVAYFLKNYISSKDIVKYKICYSLRERTLNGSYKLFMLQTLTLKTTTEGALLKVFGSHTNINHITSKNNYRLALIGLDDCPSYLDIDVFDDCVFNSFKPYSIEEKKSPFTKRELEILKLLAKGQSTEAISNAINISPHTVLTHRKNILRKSNFSNTAELIAECARRGYI